MNKKKLDNNYCIVVPLQQFFWWWGFIKMRHEEDFTMFLELCLKTKEVSRLQELFDFFFTMEEKEHLASRMKIIKTLLEKKHSQREISQKMQVSISQITRGSNALKTIDADLLTFIENHMRKLSHEK